jgi:hypothetical protein
MASLGVNLYGKYSVNEKIRLGINIGYYSESYSIFLFGFRKFTTPIIGSFEYSFSTNNFSPFIGADVGIYRLGGKGDGLESVAEVYFGLAPVFGLNYNISESILLNGNFKYHYIATNNESSSAIGLNVGIGLKF